MKIYYCEELDLLAIVEGDQIWKYLGAFCKHPLLIKVAEEYEKWYRGEVHPENFKDFKLIGEF